MPVDTKHPSFSLFYLKWKRMRDVLGGEDMVKLAGEAYLPRLSDQTMAEYEAYKRRAQFFNAVARTLFSLLGFVFRKDPTTTVPAPMAVIMDDATMTGLTWYDFTRSQVGEVLAMGRAGTLVDFDSNENRPYCVSYRAENIWNWHQERIAGQVLLTLLTLYECDGEYMELTAAVPVAVPGGAPVPATELANSGAEGLRRGGLAREPDEFEHEEFEQWRVYTLELDAAGDPYVVCTVYRKRDAEKQTGNPEFVIVQQVIPTRRGVALDRIPFVFHGPHNSLPDVEKPPLEDLALVNLSLYVTSADLENGRHFCGVPTPWAAGFDVTASGVLKVGCTTAWVTDKENAKVGYLEFTGGGLQSLEKAVEQKKQEMTALGARMLQPEAKKAEAYDTVAVRSAAETSALTAATVSCTQSLSRVLQLLGWWVGIAEHPEDLRDSHAVELNTEYTVAALPADQISALTTAYLGGAMDWESFFWKMQQGEYFPPDADPETVRSNILGNQPGFPPPPPPAGGGAGGA